MERGKSREEIAELIGVTIGSLQVTCSRLGISLRRPIFNTGVSPLRRDEPHSNGVSTTSPSRDGDRALLQLSKERSEQNSRFWPVEQAQAVTPWQEWAKRANEAGAASFAIRMQYRGEERTTELPLTQDMIGQLAFEAAFRNVTIGKLIGQLIVAVANEDLLQTVLEYKKPDKGKEESRSAIIPSTSVQASLVLREGLSSQPASPACPASWPATLQSQ